MTEWRCPACGVPADEHRVTVPLNDGTKQIGAWKPCPEGEKQAQEWEREVEAMRLRMGLKR